MALTAQEQQNLQTVQGFFQSFLNNTLFDYIDNNFHPDIKPRIVTRTAGINNPSDYSDNTFEHELQGLDPLTGLKEGIPELKNFFIDISSEYNVLDFQIGKFVVEDNNVVVVGTLNYENIETGNTTGVLPFFIDFILEDGKITEYSTYDDTFSFGATARQGGRWRSFWDEEWTNTLFGTTEAETLSGEQTEKNVIYGYQDNDTLNGGENNDVLWGGEGDDSLDGNGGEDTLYGNAGNNTLTGGLGNDVFNIGVDQGNNTITDFVKGEDLIGLTGNLTFDDLSINPEDNNTVISLQGTGTTLATLTGVAANTLEESDFYLIPNVQRKTADNVAIVQGFFDSFISGTYEDYIDQNFHPEVEYIVVQDETQIFGPEREATLTHTGLYEGQDGAKYFFDQTNTERDVVSFDTHQVIGSGDSVLAFGSFRYRAPLSRGGSGDLGETEWVSKIELLDGKIISYTFMEDSYQVAAFYRRQEEGVQQRREFNGQTRDILTGTNTDDTIAPLEVENVNFIFGYGGNDTITGGNQGDKIYGGIGNNVLTGSGGQDLFIIGEGATGTVRHRHNGPDSDDFTLDTITDFQKGEDKLGLANGLTWAELAFTTNGNDLEIRIAITGEQIALLQGVGNITIEADDVETLPAATNAIQVAEAGPGLPDGYFIKEDPFGAAPTNPSLNENANVQLVRGFLNNFFQGGAAAKAFVADNFAANVDFTVGGSQSDLFGAERQAVLPYTGLYQGISEVESFFDIIDADRETVNYELENVFSQGDTVGAYGTYEYRSLDTGELLASEWAVRLRIVEENGKPLIEKSYFFEDTAAVVNGYLLKEPGTPIIEWTREFAGRDQTFIAATNAAEIIEGKDLISKEPSGTEPAQPLSNRIFAYGGDDTVNGKSGNDFLFGGDGDDTLNGGDGSDDLFGNQGNDNLDGGNGDDNLYGNQGNDNLTGGAGKDIFAIGKGEGSDIINDYVDGEDRIGLIGLLQFEDLSIVQSGLDTVISLISNNEILATLTGVTASDLTSDDFTKRSDSGAEINPRRDLIGFPEFNFDENYPIVDHPLVNLTPTPDEDKNLEVAQGFFSSFQNGSSSLFDYIDQNFAQDVRYTLITSTDGVNNPSDYSDDSFTHERQLILPITGLKIGQQEVKGLFEDLFSEFTLLDFQTDKYVVDANNVLVFGNFSFLNQETGNQTEPLFFISDIIIEDGKIVEVQEYYDTYSLAATTRQGGEWRRFWDEEWTNYLFGTQETDSLEGNETEKNTIYGYQNDDLLLGGNNDDVIWGGLDDDTINGKDGNDTLYGNEGSDTFVLTQGNGTDNINDFVAGEDKISLLDDLTLDQLTLTVVEGDLEIKITSTEQVIATITGLESLTSSDFIVQAEELVFGTPDNDELFAPVDLDGQRDIVFVGAGNDNVDVAVSTVGRNRIFGGSGLDTITVSTNDRVFGGSNDDIFEATDGKGGNRMSGGDGDDIFFLGYGDRALGGNGNDEFYVGEGGNNLIAGGAGADQFWVVNAQIPDAVNTILDLEIGMDVIGIGGYVEADLSFGTDDSGNATLAVDDTNVAIFIGITQAQLETANFVFM